MARNPGFAARYSSPMARNPLMTTRTHALVVRAYVFVTTTAPCPFAANPY